MFSSPPNLVPLPLYTIWIWESKKKEEGPEEQRKEGEWISAAF